MMTFGSLFAGIGGIDLGLERAGMECRWQVEIDPYATRVLEKHWPNVRRYSDVRTVGAADLDPVDVLAGGFPCQDISHAGRGAGIGGERSGLWTEYARLIRDLRPRYVLVENVPALLGRGLDVVLGTLAEIGYDAEWDCLPASAFGAPHRRDRIWIVAYPQSISEWTGLRQSDSESLWRGRPGDGSGSNDVGHAKSDGRRTRREGRSAPDGTDWPADVPQEMADADGTGPQGHGRLLQCPCQCAVGTGCWTEYRGWESESDVGRVASRVSRRVDRLRGLGNAVVPQVVEYIGRCIIEADRLAAAS